MSKQDYEKIAATISEFARQYPEYIWLVEEIARALCPILKLDNPAFDQNRFLYACGV